MRDARRYRLWLTFAVFTAVLATLPHETVAQRNRDAGRAIFVEKNCIRCHPAPGEAAAGPPLDSLRRPQGEMELAGRLWNHVPSMVTTMGQQGLEWPRITTNEMAALMAYLGAESARDATPDLGKGELAIVRKGCLKCHSLRHEGGAIQPDLASRRADYESPAAWAATMWTHTPRMAAMATQQGIPYPRFTGDEMTNLVAFLRHTAGGSTRTNR